MADDESIEMDYNIEIVFGNEVHDCQFKIGDTVIFRLSAAELDHLIKTVKQLGL